MRSPTSSLPPETTWVDLLSRRAAREAQVEALVFAPDGEEVEARYDFATLDRRARAIACELWARGVGPGSRALLLYRPGLEFVSALFGCFYAGVVAVPTYPPRRGQDKAVARAQTIISDCAPAVALTDAKTLAACEAALSGLPVVATDAFDDGSRWSRPTVSASTLAVLQYTSGSTSAPKGVMLAHAQLLANSAAIYTSFGHQPESRGVLWLPHEHDMGLIGAVLQPIYNCGPTLLMSPLAFLQEPVSWLRAISRHRGTTAGAPTFAYQLCVERVSDEDFASLDLSSWEVAFVGAEPVRMAVLERFAQTFARAGFRPEAFLPCYGLAESTLIVSGTSKGHGARAVFHAGRGLVSAGRPASSRVAIVDPSTLARVPDGEVGEVWVSGPSVALGYYGKPHDPAFDGRLDGERWLRTGDLGLIDAGEVVITGRMKDLIIVDGANHHAEDLESTVEGCHPELRPGSGAAFGVEARDGEGVVLVWETRRPRTKDDPQAISKAIRGALARQHGLPVADVVLVPPGWVPKTESGKVRRLECRRLYLGGELEREQNT